MSEKEPPSPQEHMQDLTACTYGSETDSLIQSPPPPAPPPCHNPVEDPSPNANRQRILGVDSDSVQQRSKHTTSEALRWQRVGVNSSERLPLLSPQRGDNKADGGDDDDDADGGVDDERNVRNLRVYLSDDRSDVDVSGNDAQRHDVVKNGVVKTKHPSQQKLSVTSDSTAEGRHNRDRHDVQHGQSGAGLGWLGHVTPSPAQSDVITENDVAPTLTKRQGSSVRSFTSDCIQALGVEEEEVWRVRNEEQGSALDQRHSTSAVRRLSSGDAPYCLPTQDGSSHIHLTPGLYRSAENYLIGRANPRGDLASVRVTRMTEVAPTNSSIVDEEEQWKMPLHLFTSKRKGKQISQYKSKRIRSYYKAQDQLITAYEDISLKVNDDLLDTDLLRKQRAQAACFSKLTLAVNVCLMVAKLVASTLSGSISIISSLVDSVVDLLSGTIMLWATKAVKKRDPYTYPQGRTKLEPVSIIILSVVMALASLQLVRESIEKVVILAKDPNALPTVEAPVFAIAGTTVAIKLVLWLVCRRINNPVVRALSMDHRNDVLSNSVAIVCGYLGSNEFQTKTHLEGFIFIDPAGAILISLYIVINWWQTGSEQIKMLTGHTARPDFLSKLTWTAMNHDPHICHIDTVRAFHFGNNFLVELDIVLPEDMSLRMAHDIGESLQQKLENIPEVERAFVHLDYEYSHNPNSEHKVV